MVKFKVELTVSSQTLFGIIAKLLPPEDHLHIEEIMEDAVSKPSVEPPHPQLVKPKLTNRSHFKHPSGKSAQDLVLEYMQRNQEAVSWNDMGNYIKKLGFHKSSINNAITRLANRKLIERVSPGMYKLANNLREKKVV
jgi:hypothetical protein